MIAYDALGREVWAGDVVACTVGGSYYASSIKVGRVERVFEGTGSHRGTIKASVSLPRKDRTGVVIWERKPFYLKGKCVKLERFDLDAYASNL